MSSSLALLLVFTCGLTAVPSVDTQEAPLLSVNVRPSTARLADGLRLGMLKSPTMRALVGALDASDVVVYLREGACGSRSVACMMFGSVSGRTRVLHINFRLADSTREVFLGFRDRLIAQIGHELQHALEIANDTSVVDVRTMTLLYTRIGRRADVPGESRYETDAAIRVGRLVMEEYRRRDAVRPD